MEFKNIILKKENGIATITLNRPEAPNAINKEMMLELQRAVKYIKNDESIKVLIIKKEPT